MKQTEAQVTVNQLQLDRHVRCLAKAGHTQSGINYFTQWEICDIAATFGAGTNSASVRLPDGTYVYHASNYGLHVLDYRPGPWVDRLIADAEKLQQELNRKALEERADPTARVISFFRG